MITETALIFFYEIYDKVSLCRVDTSTTYQKCAHYRPNAAGNFNYEHYYIDVSRCISGAPVIRTLTNAEEGLRWISILSKREKFQMESLKGPTRYTYDVISKLTGSRVYTSSDFEFALKSHTDSNGKFNYGDFRILASRQGSNFAIYEPTTINDEDDELCWNDMLARRIWMSTPSTAAPVKVAPKEASNDTPVGGVKQYYEGAVKDMMYIDLMQYLLKGKDPMEAAYLTHIYKYLMRAGKKDANPPEKEYDKALWYMEQLVAYFKHQKREFLAKDAKKILARRVVVK